MPKKLTIDKVLEKFYSIHGDQYDYSDFKEYHGASVKIPIKCKIHGVFMQQPCNHINNHGCPHCGNMLPSNTETFRNSVKDNPKNTNIDYSKVVYVKAHNKVILICKLHGEFEITPHHHLKGKSCRKCAIDSNADRKRKSLDIFIEQATAANNNLYDYSNTIYINSKTKVKITCLKHGEFEQIPSVHLKGQGCPRCFGKWLCEKYCREIFEEIYEVKFNTSYPSFLKLGARKQLELDGFNEDLEIAFEYNGKQHYKHVKFFHTEEKFKQQQDYDKIKIEKCKENNIYLIIIPYQYKTSESIKEFIISELNDRDLLPY